MTALRAPYREWLGVCAAGRTDAGVHATGQVVQFYWDGGLGGAEDGGEAAAPDAAATAAKTLDLDPTRGLPARLNGLLPPDIRVLAALRTAPDFVATASATAKAYRYEIDLLPGLGCDPLSARRRAQVPPRRTVDFAAVERAARLFEGTHDFSAFSNRDGSSSVGARDPVKTIEVFEVALLLDGEEEEREEEDGGVWVGGGRPFLRIDVRGTGFLYKQVRHMVGALLSVGMGQLDPQEIARRLERGANWRDDDGGSGSDSGSDSSGGGGDWRGYNVAPAKGLCLRGVRYPRGAFDSSALLYPWLEHDAWGRLRQAIPPETVRAARREAAARGSRRRGGGGGGA